METIRLTGDDWRLLRDVRLAALADAPYAYGSSLAIEEGFGEADWRRRLGGAGLWTIARHGDETVGLVGAFVPDDTPMLVAMWVRPGSRGLGVGAALITAVLRWAAADNRWSRVVLRVADGNDAARKLFLRHGFEPTGMREPLESDPGVSTELLSRAI